MIMRLPITAIVDGCIVRRFRDARHAQRQSLLIASASLEQQAANDRGNTDLFETRSTSCAPKCSTLRKMVEQLQNETSSSSNATATSTSTWTAVRNPARKVVRSRAAPTPTTRPRQPARCFRRACAFRAR